MAGSFENMNVIWNKQNLQMSSTLIVKIYAFKRTDFFIESGVKDHDRAVIGRLIYDDKGE